MESMLDWGGEQMSLYLGKELGDLLIITLNKCVSTSCFECTSPNNICSAVEATLAVILVFDCKK